LIDAYFIAAMGRSYINYLVRTVTGGQFPTRMFLIGMRLAGSPCFIQCLGVKVFMAQSAPAELRLFLDVMVLRNRILVFGH
jgi:hypothetical protein